MEAFFHYKSFLLSTKFTLKTERDATSTEKQIANVFCNRFVNVTKSWNIPEVNPQKARNNTDFDKILENSEQYVFGLPRTANSLIPFFTSKHTFFTNNNAIFNIITHAYFFYTF